MSFLMMAFGSYGLPRNFGSAIRAINTGYEQLKGVEYDFVGNLDADVVLEPNYYETTLAKFQANPRLGLAGGLVCDRCWDRLDEEFTAADSVRGPVQMFRRECYEQIGGYTGMVIGGEDSVAEIKARMHGWQVRTFPEIKALHLRPTGTAKSGILSARFRQGKIEHRVRFIHCSRLQNVSHASDRSPTCWAVFSD